MLTAILPIHINQNPFWSSATGLECIENFIKTCKQISEIDRFVVITHDVPVCCLAEKYGMEIVSVDIPGILNLPYTFEQSRSLARNFRKSCIKQNDAIIIVDHRNLSLSVDDITEALIAHQQNPEAGVISLAFCRDYPCQWKSYFKFLGCVVINFEELGIMDEVSNIHRAGSNRGVTCHTKDDGEITISLSTNGPRCCISFYSPNKARESFVAQILPFAKNGPLDGQSREILVTKPEYETLLDIDATQITGMISILTMPSQAGEYDTVEIFTPPNASWELGGSGSTVASTKTHEPMFGRQQFPSAYTYDGSLCILGVGHLPEKMTSVPNPLILKNSCIVTDWVDYWYTVTAQLPPWSKKGRP